LNSVTEVENFILDGDEIQSTTNSDIDFVPNGTGNLNVTYGTNELNLDPQLQKASIISNGSFERGITGISCTGADPFSEDTVVANVENNNRSLRIVTDGSVDWSCDIPLKGGMVGGEQFFYSLFSNTSLQTVEVCLFNGTIERNCQELKGISDWYEFYSGLNQAFATNNALRIKGADSEATGTVYVDLVDSQLGLPKIGPSKNCPRDVDCENTLSATISTTGVVSGEKPSDWIDGNCSVASTAQYTCNFNTSVITEEPKCSVYIINSGGNYTTTGISQSATQFRYDTRDAGGGSLVAREVNIFCTKSGADFKPITEQGVVVTGQASSANLKQNKTQAATVSTTPVLYNLADADIDELELLSVDESTDVVTALKATRVAVLLALPVGRDSTAHTIRAYVEVNDGSGFTAREDCGGVRLGNAGDKNNLLCIDDFRLNKGDSFRIYLVATGSVITNEVDSILRIRSVLDRQSIVGDLQGMVKVSGVTSRVETGWASFGGATDESTCASSPCTRHRSVGAAAQGMSVTRSGAGLYEITSTGWKPNANIICDFPTSSRNDNFPMPIWAEARGWQANSSGVVVEGFRTGTNIAAGTTTDAYFQVKCTGEVP